PLGDKFARLWEEEVARANGKKRTPSLLRVILRAYAARCMLYGMVLLFMECGIRPGAYRAPSRTSGPLKAGNVCRYVRPVLRDAALHRRSSAAQTDVCALPNRWSSDGYLAHKIDVCALPNRWSSDGYLAHKWASQSRQRVSLRADGYLAHKMSVVPTCMPTLPQRAAPAPGPCAARRLTVPNARPAPSRDDSRRILLSDIGFTSMVPELSRSADPVWALGKRMQAESPASTSTSKFLSRGSSYRSPCLSIDRSSDWIPQSVYVPSSRMYGDCRAWRSSLPDVRRAGTEELCHEADLYLRRSTDNLRYTSLDMNTGCVCGCSCVCVRSGDIATTTIPEAVDVDNVGLGNVGISVGNTSVGLGSVGVSGRPYIPREPKQLRLGHMVKVIAPHGRLVIGRVRYVGLAGGTAASSGMVVGAEFPCAQAPGLARNDGTHRGRRYFLAPPGHGALFVPFSKVVMAWAN
ncbi:uncharacterized protein LOC114366724, partial [Ostrinia furnacalis]|uniref:uncharacterized protein LOC114366724 n=1 Tax=Ostrinia furnacalis TaxID=93504 RepID=UPI00103E2F0D